MATALRRARAARRRDGNYSLMLAVVIIVILGFGALSIDVAYMRYAQAQCQDVADAASQAALIVLRQTGSEAQATAAAEKIITVNEVAGAPPSVVNIQFGNWDDTLADPSFTMGGGGAPNAVSVTVARNQDNASSVPFLLARIFGQDTFDVQASAVSATRSFQIILVLDITGSWHEDKFADARDAVLQALDMAADSASGVDEVGMTIFTNRYAWEYTPFTQISVGGNAAAVRADWEKLNIASKGGTDVDHYDGVQCALKPSSSRNDFTNPDGGCYPDMPREYTDESGTDHSTGILQAKQMYEAAASGAAYRAMIIITDGKPNDLGAASGNARAAEGYVEARWPEYQGPVPRSKTDIRNESIAATQDLWTNMQVNTWMVSLVQRDAAMMPGQEGVPVEGLGSGVPQGDGYWRLAAQSSELATIISQIISEMPLAIVE